MNIKKLLLFIALASAIIVALSHSVSLFGGQHTWYELGVGIPCGKCHADICEEFSGAHLSLGDGNDACATCHRVNMTGYTYADGEGAGSTPGKEVHASTTISCDCCHFNSSNPFTAPVAGGFGLSNLGSSDTGVNASHHPFVNQSADSGILWNSSESCVACHTPVKVKINFNVSTEATIIVNNTYSASSSFWDIENMYSSDYKTYKEEK